MSPPAGNTGHASIAADIDGVDASNVEASAEVSAPQATAAVPSGGRAPRHGMRTWHPGSATRSNFPHRSTRPTEPWSIHAQQDIVEVSCAGLRVSLEAASRASLGECEVKVADVEVLWCFPGKVDMVLTRCVWPERQSADAAYRKHLLRTWPRGHVPALC